MNEVMERAAAYEEAGADAFWFPGLPLQEHPKAAAVVKKPLMSTDGTLAQLKDAKVAFAAILDFGTISLGAVRRALQELKTTGSVQNATKEALPRNRVLDGDRADAPHVVEIEQGVLIQVARLRDWFLHQPRLRSRMRHFAGFPANRARTSYRHPSATINGESVPTSLSNSSSLPSGVTSYDA